MNRTQYLSKIAAYLCLMRFDRPIGTLLLLWPTLWALWVAAAGFPPVNILIIFIVGVIVMRAAGCVINDYVDRNIDGHVRRTKERPLVTRAVSAHGALILFACLCVGAAILVLQLNKMTIFLAVAGLLLVIFYPFAKRYIAIPQLVLAVAFSFSILMSFAAVTNTVPLLAWVLFFTNFCWIMVYDTQYALIDRDDDLKIGVNSSAIFFGRYERIAIAFFQLMVVSLLGIAGWLARWNLLYWYAVGAVLVLFLYQQVLIFKLKPDQELRAFLSNNWVGAIIFLGIALQGRIT